MIQLIAQIGVPSGGGILRAYASFLLQAAVWAVLAFGTLVVLVIGLILIRRRRGRVMVFCGAALAIVLAYVAYVSLVKSVTIGHGTAAAGWK
jgi:hypothetical protein